jgi:hypothetical protein
MTRATSVLSATTFLALVLAGAIPAFGQEDPHSACAMPPSYVPAELRERTIPLRRGIGNSHEAVTTESAEAAVFYN